MPRLLDLFCGAGGAAAGYFYAGFFDIVGVDNRPQKNYPFEFVQADALEYVEEHWREFDAIHASPPCQAYSRLRHLPWLRGKVYWDSIPPTRAALLCCGVPWVMENVEDAPMPDAAVLCGQTFGLPIFRHRRFDSSFPLLQPAHSKHSFTITPGGASLGKRHHGLNAWNGEAGYQGGVKRHRLNMGIFWMTQAELGRAVPPVYTEYVGRQLLAFLGRAK